jgi:hypothetical protein
MWGSGGIAPQFLIWMEVSGQLHTLVTLLTGKEPPYPLDMRLGRSQSRSGHCGEEKNLTAVSIRTPAVPASSPSLHQLSYPDSFSRLKRTPNKKQIWSRRQAMFSFKMLVDFQRTTRRRVPEDRTRHNLRSGTSNPTSFRHLNWIDQAYNMVLFVALLMTVANRKISWIHTNQPFPFWFLSIMYLSASPAWETVPVATQLSAYSLQFSLLREHHWPQTPNKSNPDRPTVLCEISV